MTGTPCRAPCNGVASAYPAALSSAQTHHCPLSQDRCFHPWNVLREKPSPPSSSPFHGVSKLTRCKYHCPYAPGCPQRSVYAQACTHSLPSGPGIPCASSSREAATYCFWESPAHRTKWNVYKLGHKLITAGK